MNIRLLLLSSVLSLLLAMPAFADEMGTGTPPATNDQTTGTSTDDAHAGEDGICGLWGLVLGWFE